MRVLGRSTSERPGLHGSVALVIGLYLVGSAACSPPTSQGDDGLDGPLTIYSGRREPLIQPLVDRFLALHPGLQVVLKAGDNVELANALLEERSRPQADIFLTTEVLTVERLFQEDALEAYRPPQGELIPAAYRQPGSGWTPLTLRARVIMVNTDQVDLEQYPRSVLDLTDPQWRGRIAAAGSTNGSMQAHVAALRQLIGEQATEEWLRGLIENEVTFFGSHTDVRNAVGTGEFALGLVNHYYYHLQVAEGSPVDVIYPDQGFGEMGTVINATAAGIVRGARHRATAEAWIDFLLSDGQQLFAELNYEYPILPEIPLHPLVQPLSGFRVADFELALAVAELEATLDLMDRVGLP